MLLQQLMAANGLEPNGEKVVSAVYRRKIANEVAALFFVTLLSFSNVCYASFIRTAATGRTWTVANGSSGYTAIQQAINDASDGDTILVSSGTYYENIVVNKTLSILGEDQSSTIIDGGGDWMTVVVTADSVTLKNFTIQHGIVGVVLEEETEGNMLLNNRIVFNSYHGIYGDRCGKNVMANNNVSFNGGHGIFLYAAKPCVLEGNLILSNGGYGIFLRYMSNGTVEGNCVSGNGDCGIYLYSDEDPERPSGLAKNNVLRDNYVSNETWGIKVCHFGADMTPARNEIYNNSIVCNKIGLNVSGSNSNSLYNNNFVNNLKQVSVYDSFNTAWDRGYYVGGNYWSDCNGSDLFWGLHQNETGSDGIVDVPYPVSSHSVQDSYPFVHENGWQATPEIHVISPTNGTFRLDNIPLVFATNKPACMSYSLDDRPNVTAAVGNLMLMDLPVGVHNLTVWANDTLGNEVSSMVVFTITFFADLNLDGSVNKLDVFTVVYSFWSSYGSEKWNSDADLNYDRQINIIDVAIVALEFGKTIC